MTQSKSPLLGLSDELKKRERELLKLRKKQLELIKEQKALEEDLPHIYVPMYEWQRKVYESDNRVNLITAANQIGKAVLCVEPIPTPSGFTDMGDIRVGDRVFGRDGRECIVTDIPFEGDDFFYRLVFSTGDELVVSQNHLWICKGPEERFRKFHKYNRGKSTGKVVVNDSYDKWVVRSTREIVEHSYQSIVARPPRKYVLPVTEAVEYPTRELFDPYYVGLYLGNGSTESISFNKLDEDLLGYCLKYGNKRHHSTSLLVGISSKTKEVLFTLGCMLRSYDKEIPASYMLGDIEQRKSLLAGLLDTDGHTSNGNVEFYSTSKKLAEQVKELVHSLGGLAQISKKGSPYYKNDVGERVVCHDCYRVQIWVLFNPFRSKRKSAEWVPNTRYRHELVIDRIEPVGIRRGKCITVTSDDSSFLCSRNYVVTHNSSILIRRVIANCTDQARWERFWGPNAVPRQFWYFYPDLKTLEREIETKWVPEWMPRGRFEKDAQYGWKLTKKNGAYNSCVFNAGPIIYFQTYTKNVSNIQAGTIHETLVDEELPMEFYDEIMFRLTATAGIFTSGFTPTLNQLFWKQAMEGRKILPSALKLQISMYDCLKYEDGSPSRVMTLDKIKLAEEKCKNETERQRRIYGKFVTEEGRTYYAFDYDENVVRPYSIKGWFIYAAVDYGSGVDEGSRGGRKNHPAAIVFVAVRPDYKKAAIFKSWRGDGEKTTAGDVFLKYQELSKGLTITQACYDAAAADFGTIAIRNGVSFVKADKARDAGEDLVNTLFKHKMLDIFDDDPENLKLAGELLTIMVSKQRGDSKKDDDLADSTRYVCKLIPWDLSAVDELVGVSEEVEQERKARPMTEEEFNALQIKMRRGEDVGGPTFGDTGWGELEEEFDHWNGEYGS